MIKDDGINMNDGIQFESEFHRKVKYFDGVEVAPIVYNAFWTMLLYDFGLSVFHGLILRTQIIG